MRRPEVRMRLTRVEMLARRIAEAHLHRLGPVEEIGGVAAADGAEPREVAASPRAQVEHVTLFARGPKRDVLRIEGALGDQRHLAQLAPAESVRGHEPEEPSLGSAGERLETLGGGHPGTRVEERREVVRERRLAGEYHVVAARCMDFKESQ